MGWRPRIAQRTMTGEMSHCMKMKNTASPTTMAKAPGKVFACKTKSMMTRRTRSRSDRSANNRKTVIALPRRRALREPIGRANMTLPMSVVLACPSSSNRSVVRNAAVR